MKFSLKLSYHKVYFSATWCKRSLLYDQTIEDINIFSPGFLVELRGVTQITWWLKLPHSPPTGWYMTFLTANIILTLILFR